MRAQGAGPPSGVRIYLAADNICIETKPYILRIKCFANQSKCGAVFREASVAVTCLFAALLMSLNHHHLHSLMDRASQALAQRLPSEVSRTYAVLADRGKVPLSTLHHRARGRRSKEYKA